jgi:hypothetical protein
MRALPRNSCAINALDTFTYHAFRQKRAITAASLDLVSNQLPKTTPVFPSTLSGG